jgi:hypothetical protein
MGRSRDQLYDKLNDAVAEGNLTAEDRISHLTGWMSDADCDNFGEYLEGAEVIHWSDDDDDDGGCDDGD